MDLLQAVKLGLEMPFFVFHLTMTQITSVIYCLSTSFVSLYFDLKTLFVSLKFSVIKKRKYRNDFYLLVYALMQFSVQLCMSANYACNGYGAMTGNSTMLSLAHATNPYILTVFCLSSPICLFATSKMLQRAYVTTFLSLDFSVRRCRVTTIIRTV